MNRLKPGVSLPVRWAAMGAALVVIAMICVALSEPGAGWGP